MGGATDLQQACRALALGVTMIGLFLGLRQWYEGKAREVQPPDDPRYFRRQSTRRHLGVGVMFALAGVLLAASWVSPRLEGGRGNPRFVLVWLLVLGLIAMMLVVALFDWLATRTYELRRRRAILHAELERLRDEVRNAAARRLRSQERPGTEPQTDEE